jgi:hypothetical protein
MGFIRMYGMEGDPGPRPAPKRKSAGAGTRVKASRKRVVRSQRAARGGNIGSGNKGKAPGKKSGFNLAALGKDRLGGILDQLRGGNVGGALGTAVLGTGRSMGGGGGGRRTINPANVKALKRSLRRVERFGSLVKRVNSLLPRAHKFQVHPVLKHKKRRRVA